MSFFCKKSIFQILTTLRWAPLEENFFLEEIQRKFCKKSAFSRHFWPFPLDFQRKKCIKKSRKKVKISRKISPAEHRPKSGKKVSQILTFFGVFFWCFYGKLASNFFSKSRKKCKKRTFFLTFFLHRDLARRLAGK